MMRWRRTAAGALLSGAVVVVGCRDQSTATEPEPLGAPAVHATAVGVDDAWDGFGVDVKVETSRLDSAGKLVIGQHPLYYHLERQVTSAGNWNLVVTFGSRARQAVTNTTGNFPAEAYEVARIEDDGDGSPRRLYDGTGQQISMQLPAGLAAGGSGATPAGGGGGASGRVSPASDRNWVGAYVLTAATAATRTASLEREFGQPRLTSGGMDEYTAQRDSIQLTVDVDPTSGGIVSMVERVGGTVRRRWTTAYDRQSDGTAVKRQVRVETPAGHGHRWARSTVTTFSNVQFERGIGS
jgi:hypothetical protein